MVDGYHAWPRRDAGLVSGDDDRWAAMDAAGGVVAAAALRPSTMVVGLALHGQPASNSVVEHGYVFCAMKAG